MLVKIFFLLLLHLSFATLPCPAAELPARDEVGPDAMPEEIAPVEAPFEMSAPQPPDIADKRVSIVAFGARANGELATEEIQRAIDETSADGGGVVVIPAGEWHTGRIVLKSGVNLHLETDAKLHFSGEIEDYLPVVFARYEGIEVMTLGGLIYAHEQTDIAITGRGELIGPTSGPVREALPGLSDQVVDPDTPVEERVFDGREGRHYFRPYFISPVDCQRVLIEGVTLHNGPMWNVVPIYCEDVVVRGVTVHSKGVVNGDGVNIESSRNVLVEYCSMNTGDDCYALKAGRDEFGLRVGRPVENVVFRFNHAEGGYGGITCGSETAGGIRNVHLHDCLFENVRHCIYMKTRRPRGGGGERITIERVKFNAYNHGIFFDMIGAPMYVGELGNRLPRRAVTEATPFYRDITIRDLQGTAPRGDVFKIKGIPESPATRILLERVSIDGEGLPNLADVRHVTVRECQFSATRARLLLLDAVDVLFAETQLGTEATPPQIVVRGETSRRIRFEDCSPEISRANVQLEDDLAAEVVGIEE